MALHEACYVGDLAAVRALLDEHDADARERFDALLGLEVEVHPDDVQAHGRCAVVGFETKRMQPCEELVDHERRRKSVDAHHRRAVDLHPLDVMYRVWASSPPTHTHTHTPRTHTHTLGVTYVTGL